MGCRGAAPQPELLRLTASGGRLVADPSRRAPGRGVYLHPDAACLERALRGRVLARALRVGGLDVPGETVEWIREWRRSESTR